MQDRTCLVRARFFSWETRFRVLTHCTSTWGSERLIHIKCRVCYVTLLILWSRSALCKWVRCSLAGRKKKLHSDIQMWIIVPPLHYHHHQSWERICTWFIFTRALLDKKNIKSTAKGWKRKALYGIESVKCSFCNIYVPFIVRGDLQPRSWALPLSRESK